MYVSVNCGKCGKEFARSKGHYDEAVKFGWKQFCSSMCLSESRTTGQKCICENPLCRKQFVRQKNEFNKSKLHFCSRSCIAKYHNATRQISVKPRKCLRSGCNRFVICQQTLYCSRKCATTAKRDITKYSAEKVIEIIGAFVSKHKRIPTRNELGYLNRLARRFFGTWNDAINAAGFEPNPVRFSKHFVANDGHPCDSLSEKIIDDWLFARKIPHEVKVKYPWNNGMSADFKVGPYWIELFGLAGQLRTYDRLMRIKLKLIKKHDLNLISIYLSDLFPKNHLAEKLVF